MQSTPRTSAFRASRGGLASCSAASEVLLGTGAGQVLMPMHSAGRRRAQQARERNTHTHTHLHQHLRVPHCMSTLHCMHDAVLPTPPSLRRVVDAGPCCTALRDAVPPNPFLPAASSMQGRAALHARRCAAHPSLPAAHRRCRAVLRWMRDAVLPNPSIGFNLTRALHPGMGPVLVAMVR